MDYIDYYSKCRVCLDEGTLNIHETMITMDEMDIEVSVAFQQFSSLNCARTSNKDLPILLCDSCLDGLLQAYDFLQKVQKSDEQYTNNQNADFFSPKLETQSSSLINNENIEMAYIDNEYDLTEESANQNSNCDLNENEEKTQHTTNPAENEDMDEYEFTNSSKRFKDDDYVGLAVYDIVDFQSNSNELIPEIDGSIKIAKTVDISIRKINVHEIDEALKFPKASNNVSMYSCRFCPKAFSTPYHLIIHIRKSHLCPFCLETFIKLTDLFQHVKQAHRKFECYLCDKHFLNNTNLRAHIRRWHNITLPAFVSLLTLKDYNET